MLSGIGVGITAFLILSVGFNLQFLVLGIPFSAIFVFIFIMGMTYTTKFLDGMDGLAGQMFDCRQYIICSITDAQSTSR